MIAALFVETRGVYFDLPNVEPWDQTRDARLYAGPHPVVAHPPCERWGRYWGGGPSVRVPKLKGDDDGCFAAAIASVRKWGGVLEHPEASHAWRAFGLTAPPKRGGWIAAGDAIGWTCCVEQGHYGHRARKATWLYAVGQPSLPALEWGPSEAQCRLDAGYHSAEERRAAGPRAQSHKRLSKVECAATPIAFRDALIRIAESAIGSGGCSTSAKDGGGMAKGDVTSSEKTYEQFIAEKMGVDVPTGIAHDVELAPHLYPYQADITRWALKRGRAALFLDCGLGKGPCALEWAHHVAAHTGKPVLILTPLAVAHQFVREGLKFGRPCGYVRDQSEVRGSIVATNYERLDKFDPSAFGGVVADESSCLKAHDARTRAQVVEAFASMPFKLSCTATPSPNDHRELGGQAHFLGIMTEAEMLSRYFIHDAKQSSGQGWRLKKWGRKVFWQWVCSWAAMLRRPSDLGYSDAGHELPGLDYHSHVTKTDLADAWKSGTLFVEEARGIQGRRAARRTSLDDRVAVAAKLVAESSPDEQWLLWVGLNDEGNALQSAIPGATQVAGSDTSEDKEARLIAFAEGRARVLVTKPSIAAHGLNFQTCRNMAFVGMSDSFEDMYQAVRRCHRAGQTRDVNVHIIASEAEGGVVTNVKRKADEHAAMAEAMVAEMRESMAVNIRGAAKDTDDYKPTVPMRVPRWLKENVEASS